jgi:hypothetical protein
MIDYLSRLLRLDPSMLFASKINFDGGALGSSSVRFILSMIALFGMQLAHAPATDLEPVQHEFIVKNFKTESGAVLPEAASSMVLTGNSTRRVKMSSFCLRTIWLKCATMVGWLDLGSRTIR